MYKDFKQKNNIEETVLLNPEDNNLITLYESEKYKLNINITNLSNKADIYIEILSKDNKKYPIYISDLYCDTITSQNYQLSICYEYYNPFEKKWEHTISYDILDSNNVTIKFITIENFFVGDKILPNVLTSSDYNKIVNLIIKEPYNNILSTFNLCYLNESVSLNDVDIIENWGLDHITDKNILQKGVHVLRPILLTGTYRLLGEHLNTLGMNTEDKRKLESKAVKDGYEAYMAMVTLNIDLSGEYPSLKMDYDMISPKHHDVSELYFGGKDIDWNEYFKEIYQDD